MKKIMIGLILLSIGSLHAVGENNSIGSSPAAKKEATWKKVAKTALGAGATISFGLLAYKHVMVDLQKPKGYLQNFAWSSEYFKKNAGKMYLDLLKLAGFMYLTYKSGSYTLSKVSELTKPSGQGLTN